MYVALVARQQVVGEQELYFHPSEVSRWGECLERRCDQSEAVSPRNANPSHRESKPYWGPLAFELDRGYRSVVELRLVALKTGDLVEMQTG